MPLPPSGLSLARTPPFLPLSQRSLTLFLSPFAPPSLPPSPPACPLRGGAGPYGRTVRHGAVVRGVRGGERHGGRGSEQRGGHACEQRGDSSEKQGHK